MGQIGSILLDGDALSYPVVVRHPLTVRANPFRL